MHLKARDLLKAGADIVEMTIGEPDVPVPDALVEAEDWAAIEDLARKAAALKRS